MEKIASILFCLGVFSVIFGCMVEQSLPIFGGIILGLFAVVLFSFADDQKPLKKQELTYDQKMLIERGKKLAWYKFSDEDKVRLKTKAEGVQIEKRYLERLLWLKKNNLPKHDKILIKHAFPSLFTLDFPKTRIDENELLLKLLNKRISDRKSKEAKLDNSNLPTDKSDHKNDLLLHNLKSLK